MKKTNLEHYGDFIEEIIKMVPENRILVLGDKHVSGNLPPHLYGKMERKEPEFQFFHKEEYIYRAYQYSNLLPHLPGDTNLDPKRIVQLKSNTYKYRFQTLLNAEQEAKETNHLRPAIEEDRVTEYIGKKTGVKEENLKNMKEIKQAVEREEKQRTLSELDHLF